MSLASRSSTASTSGARGRWAMGPSLPRRVLVSYGIWRPHRLNGTYCTTKCNPFVDAAAPAVCNLQLRTRTAADTARRGTTGADADKRPLTTTKWQHRLANLALALRAQGLLPESARLYRESLAIKHWQRACAPVKVLYILYSTVWWESDHHSVAASLSLHNLGLVLQEQGDSELHESARLHRESLAMKRRLFGELEGPGRHWHTAWRCHLAIWCSWLMP